ncbi:MAG: TadG family pilus assembly protein [Sphingomonas fennica]
MTILAAASLLFMLGSLAFAVDLGSVFLANRRVQGVADAAAMAAVVDLSRPSAAAAEVIGDNGLADRATASVDLGRWRPEAAAGDRFQADSRPNAVRVTVEAATPLYFSRVFGRNEVRIVRRATAARTDLAAFSLGARLAALDGGVANALLSGLAGSEVRLTAADSDALVTADLDLLAFTGALRTQLALGAATFDQVLATRATVPQALAAAAAALEARGDAGAAAALRRLAPATAALPTTPLSPLLSLGPLGRQDHAATGTAIRVNTFAFTQALLALAGGGRQVRVDLGTLLPGLARASLRLSIGQHATASPWIALVENGEVVVRTGQVRMLLDMAVGAEPSLRTLGVAQLRVPLFVELGRAEARLSSLSCGAGARAVSLSVTPAIGHVAIADVPDGRDFEDHGRALAENPAALVALPLVSVLGSARIDLSGSGAQTVPFTGGEIDAGTVKTIEAGRPFGGIAASLARRTSLAIAVGPLRLPDLGLGAAVGTTLSLAAPVLDAALATVTGLAGLHLGQADVRVNGLRCGVPALVG